MESFKKRQRKARVAVEEVVSEQPACGEHGEMALAEAQRTQAVHVKEVVSVAEIRQLLEAHERLQPVCGLNMKKHVERTHT
jgi:hypothetical protein